jgi:hypothetical protein
VAPWPYLERRQLFLRRARRLGGAEAPVTRRGHGASPPLRAPLPLLRLGHAPPDALLQQLPLRRLSGAGKAQTAAASVCFW